MVDKISRRRFLNYSMKIGLCAGIGYPIAIEPNWLKVERVEVPIADLPVGLNGLTIGFISDLHRGRFFSENDIRKASNVLQSLGPDLIMLGGDFIKGKVEYIDSCAQILSELRAPLGVYAILGNHEYWTNPDIAKSSLIEHGIKVLMNESVEVEWQNAHLYLVGLDDAWEGRPDIRGALEKTSSDFLKILLVHEPDFADTVKKVDDWIPLQLSGHSHGGQFQIPFIGALYYPHLAKKYPVGLNRVSGTDRWVYTTRGVGGTVPFRLNCRPEISFLTLKTA